MRHLLPIHIVLLFAVGGCVPSTNGTIHVQTSNSFEAEYAVYSAVLDAFAQPPVAREVSFGAYVDGLYGDADLGSHLVFETTRGRLLFGIEAEDLVLRAMESPLRLSENLMADYAAANNTPRRLRAEAFRTSTPVRVLNDVEAEQIAEETMNSTGYPDTLPAPGHVTFSRVGFSEHGTEATLFVSFRCGGRCGNAQVLVLEQEGDRWQVMRSEIIARY